MAKGRFIPTNPQKYMGNPSEIFFRSSWELTVMKFFDKSSSVMRWASETIIVPYISPKDGRVHRYYPDFFCELINAQQELERWLIEVKPLKETSYDHAKTLHDKLNVAINEAKWDAARKFAAVNNMKFRVITELDIYKMAPPKKPKVKSTAPKKPRAVKAAAKPKGIKQPKAPTTTRKRITSK